MDGLEEIILSAGKKKDQQHFVRYSDDWICTASSKEILEQKVLPIVINFLKERGLELSSEKTKITHIDEGFDFLGCNLRKYGGKLLIKPGEKGIKDFLSSERETIFQKRNDTAIKLIEEPNPKYKGGPITIAISCQREHSNILTIKSSKVSGVGRKKDIKTNLSHGSKQNILSV